MIYLIQSAYVDENDNFHKALKIGYAKDINKRLIAYYTHSPNIKLLDSREGDEELEKHLHLYFSKYRLSNYEWFEYNEEIINNFSFITLSTILPIESIKYEPRVDKTSFVNYKSKKDPEIIKIFQDLYSIFQTTNSDINKIIKEELEKIDLRLYNKKHIDNWKEFYNTFTTIIKDKIEEIRKEQEIVKSLSFNYFSSYIYFIPNFDYDLISEDEFIEELKNLKKVYFDKESLLIDQFLNEFNQDNNFVRRMKLYCEFSEKFGNSELKNPVLKIPDDFHLYYDFIGIEKIRSCGYMENRLSNIIDDAKKNDPLLISIYNNFFEGDKYYGSTVKEKLQEIYSILGLKKAPKAVDIIEYFEVRDVMFRDKATRKRFRGYELIKRLK